MSEYERTVRKAMKAVHRIWCGTPPSCGYDMPCPESEIRRADVSVVVRVCLAGFRARLAAKEEECERLRKVLAPFAEAIRHHDETTAIEGDPLPPDEDEPWGEGIGDALTYREWRQARAALAAEEGKEEP